MRRTPSRKAFLEGTAGAGQARPLASNNPLQIEETRWKRKPSPWRHKPSAFYTDWQDILRTIEGNEQKKMAEVFLQIGPQEFPCLRVQRLGRSPWPAPWPSCFPPDPAESAPPGLSVGRRGGA